MVRRYSPHTHEAREARRIYKRHWDETHRPGRIADLAAWKAKVAAGGFSPVSSKSGALPKPNPTARHEVNFYNRWGTPRGVAVEVLPALTVQPTVKRRGTNGRKRT